MIRSTITNYLSIALLLAAAMASCTTPESPVDPVPNGQPAVIRLAPPSSRANGSASSPDDRVECLRVLVFNTHDGSIAYNKYIANASGDSCIQMMAGSYDFVFVANEKPGQASPALPISAKLNGIRYFQELENTAFSSRQINETNLIPMVSVYKDVTVTGNNKLSGYKPDGSPFSVDGNTWGIELERVAIRVDLKLVTSSHNLANAFTHVSVSKLPTEVPLLKTVYSRESFDSLRIIDKAKGTGFTPNTTNALEWQCERIILPSSRLVNPQAANAITFTAHFTNFPDLQGTLDDVATPRNNHYKLTGTLKEKANFTTEVSPWQSLSIIPQWLYVDSIAPLYILNGKDHRIRVHAEYDWTVESGDLSYLTTHPDSSSGPRGKNQWVKFNLERTYSNSFVNLDSTTVSLVFRSREGGVQTVELPVVTFPRFSANAYMAKPDGQAFDIPLTNVNHPDILSTLNLSSPRLNDGERFVAELVWQDTPAAIGSTGSCIKNIAIKQGATVKDSHITITPGATEGNALISIRKSGNSNILWSWHVWITHYDPDAIAANSPTQRENYLPSAKGSLYKYDRYLYMDRHLGAILPPNHSGSNQDISLINFTDNNFSATINLTKASGYFYQWGRKDPLQASAIRPYGSYTLIDRPVYDANGIQLSDGSIKVNNGTIANSIKKPREMFISYPFYIETKSWGTSRGKNIFDPCPEGWRVPHSPVVLPPGPIEIIKWSSKGENTPYLGYFVYSGYRIYDSGNLIGRMNQAICWTGQMAKVTNNDFKAYCFLVGRDDISTVKTSWQYSNKVQLYCKSAANVRCVKY